MPPTRTRRILKRALTALMVVVMLPVTWLVWRDSDDPPVKNPGRMIDPVPPDYRQPERDDGGMEKSNAELRRILDEEIRRHKESGEPITTNELGDGALRDKAEATLAQLRQELDEQLHRDREAHERNQRLLESVEQGAGGPRHAK